MERNENEWNVSNLVWEQHRGNGIESFYENITPSIPFFFCPLFHFEMSQNIVLFPKIKVIPIIPLLIY